MDIRGREFLVLGGGISGLSAAWLLRKLGASARIVDERGALGGIARSHHLQGAVYEFGPHMLHARTDPTIRFYQQYGIRSLDYYAKMSVDDTIQQLVDFPFSVDTIFQLPRDLGRKVVAELHALGRKEIDHTNLETYLRSVVGETLYQHFNRGYSRKFWGRDPREVPANGAAGWITFRTDDRRLYAEWQAVPEGDFGRFFDRVGKGIEVVHARVEGLVPSGNRVAGVRTSQGTLSAEHVISTIPPEFLLGSRDRALLYVGKIMVAVRVKRGPVFPAGIGGVYFPNKWKFNRICEYPSMTDPAYPNLPFGSLLGVEYNVFPWHGPVGDLDAYMEDAVAACQELFGADVLATAVHFEPDIYPIRDAQQMATFDRLRAQTSMQNLFHTGRFGQFRYVNMNDCFEMVLALMAQITEQPVADVVAQVGL